MTATQSLEQEMRDLSIAYHVCEARRKLAIYDDNALDDLESAFNARARAFQRDQCPRHIGGKPVSDQMTPGPCPFCGGESAVGTVRYNPPLDPEHTCWADGTAISIAYSVNCVSCGATNRSTVAGGYPTEAEAIEKWNRRFLVPEMVAALRAWVAYDDMDEADFGGVSPMLRYAEAINAIPGFDDDYVPGFD